MRYSLKDRMRNFISEWRYSLVKFFRAVREYVSLSKRNWKWINAASWFFLIVFTLGLVISISEALSPLWNVIAALMILSMPLIYGLGIKLALIIARNIPSGIGWINFSAISVFFIFFQASFKLTAVQLFYMLLTFIFLFGAISNLPGPYWNKLSRIKKLLTIFFLTIGAVNLGLLIYFFTYPGKTDSAMQNQSMEALHLPSQVELPDPGEPGKSLYATFTYGSGRDKHRKEYNENADLHSTTVDASSFIDNWDKLSGKLRSAYWGITPDSLPLNGRIWMPEGRGPFPLVMIVHGNHFDRDFSDAGYTYLGEHLASHEYMVISVDENFFNYSLTDMNHPLKEENDARGWLLLKHLEQIRNWAKQEDTPLFEKVDMDQLILIGHSRGGEAVSIAAAFNTLPYYPDNAKEIFDFNFGIKGIVTLAQVDGQYKPSNTPTPLQNINFLALQGSLDADLNSYMGLTQYNRVRFTDSAFHFKCGIYIHLANHGQFNTSWGLNDVGYPMSLFLNRKRILAKEKQEELAQVYITSFIKASLSQEPGYLKFLSDYRTGREWIPPVMYISQYEDSNSKIIADFEEDLDLTTASCPDLRIRFEELAEIYEERVYLKKGNSGTKAVCIGWNNTKDSLPGTYTLNFKIPPLIEEPHEKNIQFDLAVIDNVPTERHKALESAGKNEEGAPSANKRGKSKRKQGNKSDNSENLEEDECSALAFRILLQDMNGDAANISLQDYFPLNCPIQVKKFKLELIEKNSEAEAIPQHIEIPLRAFTQANPEIDLNRIQSIQFIFDQGDAGMISLDNIGFASTK